MWLMMAHGGTSPVTEEGREPSSKLVARHNGHLSMKAPPEARQTSPESLVFFPQPLNSVIIIPLRRSDAALVMKAPDTTLLHDAHPRASSIGNAHCLIHRCAKSLTELVVMPMSSMAST